MLNYEELISILTPERKLKLWQKYKNSTLSKESKYRAIYYEAKSKNYL